MSETVGAYDAKTHLPRLLDEVAKGRSVTITKHGRPVARLVPVDAGEGTHADVAAALIAGRAGIRRGRTSVAKMIADGRK